MGLGTAFQMSVVLGMVDNLTSPLKNVTNVTGNAFSAIASAGKMLTAGMGAVAGASLACITSTFETQDALGELSSLGVSDLQAVEAAAKSFSDTWAGTSKSDFITASYDIKSGIASLSDEGVAQFTKLAALTGKATKSTTEEMGSLFATGYGIYKGSYDEMSDLEFGEMFSAGISTAVKNYKTAGSEMASSISTLGATATNAKIPLEEQLAILGTLQTTMSGSEAATKYKSFLNTAAGAGKKLGLSFMDTNKQLLSMPEILTTLQSKYGDTIDAVEKQELKAAFGTDEAVALIDLLYNDVGTLKSGIGDLQGSMTEGIAVTEGMAEAINNTPAQKFDVLKQKVHNAAEEIGGQLLPTVNDAMEQAGGLVQDFSDQIANHKDQGIAGIGAAVGETLSKMVAMTTEAAPKLIDAAGMALESFMGGIRNNLPMIAEGGAETLTTFMNCIISLIPVLLLLGIDLITEFANSMISQLPSIIETGTQAQLSLVDGILQGLPKIIQTALTLIQTLVDGLISALPQIIQAAIQLISGLLQGIISMLPNILQMGLQLIMALIQGIIANLPLLLQSAVQLVVSLVNGLVQMLPLIIQSGIQLIISLIQGIISNLGVIVQSAVEIVMALIFGLIQAIPQLMAVGPQLVDAIIKTLFTTDWIQVGKDILNGIKDGILNMASSLGSSVKDSVIGFFGFGKKEEAVTEAAGAEITTSYANGITASAESAANAASLVGTEAGTAFNTGISSGIDTSAMNFNNFDANALIAGMDTTGVEAGTALTSGLTEQLSTIDMNSLTLDSSALAGGMSMAGVEAATSLGGGINEGSTNVLNSVTTLGNSAQDALNQSWTAVESDTTTAWNNISSSIVGKAKETASAIKSAFENMTIQIPAPKLPLINISYGTVGEGDAKVQVPSFSVSYFAKGGIMKEPTIFGGSGTNMMVGGEAGPEAIVPLAELWTKMRDIIGKAVNREPGAENIVQAGASIIHALTKKESKNITEKETRVSSEKFKTSIRKEREGITIQTLSIAADINKIKDLPLLYKLIDELKDNQNGSSEPRLA